MRCTSVGRVLHVHRAVLAGRQAAGVAVVGDVEEVGLDAAPVAAGVGVGVEGDEEVAPRQVGDGGALLELEVAVVGPGERDLEPVRAELLREPPRHGEGDVLLADPARADGAGVVPAVSRRRR